MGHFWHGGLDWLALSMSIAGVAIAWVGFRGRRVDGPLCPKCLYPLRGISDSGGHLSGICPECGCTIDGKTRPRNRLPGRYKKSIGRFLLTCSLALWLWNGAWMGFARVALPQYQVFSTHRIAQLDIRVLTPRWPDDLSDDVVEIDQAGRLVFRSEVAHPTVGSCIIESAMSGDPVEALWIRSDSGGTNRYSETYVFRPTPVGVLPAAVLTNGLFKEVSDSDGEPQPSIWIEPDLTYRYWLTSGFSSPVPVVRGVVVEAAGVRWFETDPELIPTDGQLAASLERVRTDAARTTEAHTADHALGAALAPFLDLVYAGQAQRAWSFLRECDAAGLGDVLRRGSLSDAPRSLEALEVALRGQIMRSPFIDLVLRRNGGSIDPPTSR